MTEHHLQPQPKQHTLRVTRGRIRRPIAVEAVPASAGVVDPKARAHGLDTALVRFGAAWIRDLIQEGIIIVDSSGNTHIRGGLQ